MFPNIQSECNSRPPPLILSLLTWEKRLISTSPKPPLLQTEQSQFPQLLPITLVFQSLHSLPRTLRASVSLTHTEPSIQDEASPELLCTRDEQLQLVLAAPCPIQARMPPAFLASRAHCRLTLSQLSADTSDPFLPHGFPATLPARNAQGRCD